MRNDKRDSGAWTGTSASVFSHDDDAFAAGSPRPVTPPEWAEKLRDIQSITDAALSVLDPRALLDALVDRAKEALQADTAAILLLDRRSGQLVATAASGLEEEVRQGVRIPVGKGFAGRIAAQGRPVILDEVDHTKVINPILLEKSIRSLMGVPLLAEGKVIGVLHVGTLTRRAFTSHDVDLLQLAADRATVAVQCLFGWAAEKVAGGVGVGHRVGVVGRLRSPAQHALSAIPHGSSRIPPPLWVVPDSLPNPDRGMPIRSGCVPDIDRICCD